MKVAFHLRRTPTAAPAVALLFPAGDVQALFACCNRLRIGAPLRVHTVAGGLLLVLPRACTEYAPGAVRLRALTPDLLLPVDAEFVPTLHADEAASLVSRRGLVFLPGGRVLEFAPREPLPLRALIETGPIRRRAWRSLPAPRRLADRLTAIVGPVPQLSPDQLLEPGGEGIGTEEPQPEGAGPAANLLGKAQVGTGRGMMWLGKLLGLPGLAKAGAKMVQDAVRRVPKLTEALLGKQEAALRALLREFREGNLEKALRRALPLSRPEDRGALAPAGNARLPFNNLLYSLANLLNWGGSGEGAGVWLGGYDVQQELTREYHRAAEAALRAGDFRRAAYIYGRLLRDYRLAANALAKGGLYHDAAVLYLSKVGDKQAAATAFEAAGEFDRAVELYRECGQPVEAGDLLARIGEDEQALVEYRRAADQFANGRHDYLAAGELLLQKAGRADLAWPYFETGWRVRPQGNPVPCALRLLRLCADEGRLIELEVVLAEADAFFEPPGNDQLASTYYNALVPLGEHRGLTHLQDDLRDRALVGLATKLRQKAETRVRTGDPIAVLLGRPGHWPQPLVSDAEHAWKAAVRPVEVPKEVVPVAHAVTSVQVGRGTVTAVGHATESGDVFLGFEDGSVNGFRPADGGVLYLPFDPGAHRGWPVTSIAVCPKGETVVVLRRRSDAEYRLTSYRRDDDGVYDRVEADTIRAGGPVWLFPGVVRPVGFGFTGIWSGDGVHLRVGDTLLGHGWISSPLPDEETVAGLLFYQRNAGPESLALLLLTEAHTLWRGVYKVVPKKKLQGGSVSRVQLPWRPHVPEGNPLEHPPLTWLWHDVVGKLELVGAGESGSIYWSEVATAPVLKVTDTNVAVRAEGYLAGALVRSRLVAGVSRSRIDWLRVGAGRFTLQSATKVFLPTSVACFASAATHELLVVCKDGVVVRVPVPC